MEAHDIATDAANVHKVAEEDLELVAREFVELLAVCETFARNDSVEEEEGAGLPHRRRYRYRPGPVEHADKFLDYAAEMYMRAPMFANAAVDAYVHRGGDLVTLIKRARERRSEVKVGGWLSYLERNCCENDQEDAR